MERPGSFSGSFSGYLRACAATIVAGALLAATFVAVVDPYRLYRLVDITGFNHEKPRPNRFQEEIKVANALAARPSAVILGNSRAESGLDPEADIWRDRGLVAYNLAIAGTGVATARRQLAELVEHHQPPQLIVVGVEFLDFLGEKGRPPVLPTAAASLTTDTWRWRIESLFSLASVADAIDTLRMQNARDAETLTARGFNPLAQYSSMARREGYYALFRQRAQENAGVYVRKETSLGPTAAEELVTLRALLDEAGRNRIEVVIAIYPYHAQLLAMMEFAGLSDAFSNWKSQLIDLVEQARTRNPGFVVGIWDFSGFEGPRCEPIPKSGDRTTVTQWYWEGGHFKRSLGERMLASMLSSPPGSATADTFGRMLTRDSLASTNGRFAAERAACEALAPGLFAEAKTLVDAARRPR